LECTAWR